MASTTYGYPPSYHHSFLHQDVMQSPIDSSFAQYQASMQASFAQMDTSFARLGVSFSHLEVELQGSSAAIGASFVNLQRMAQSCSEVLSSTKGVSDQLAPSPKQIMGTTQSREDHISDSDDEDQCQTPQSDAAPETQPTPIADIDAKLKSLKLKYASPSSSAAVHHNAVKLYLHIGDNTHNAKWIVSNKLTSYSFVKSTNPDGDSDDDDYEGSEAAKGQWILKVDGKVRARVSTDMQLKMFADQRRVDFVSKGVWALRFYTDEQYRRFLTEFQDRLFENVYWLKSTEENKVKIDDKEFLGWVKPEAADDSAWDYADDYDMARSLNPVTPVRSNQQLMEEFEEAANGCVQSLTLGALDNSFLVNDSGVQVYKNFNHGIHGKGVVAKFDSGGGLKMTPKKAMLMRGEMNMMLMSPLKDGNPIESRRLAGIILKNSLDAKDVVTKERLAEQWMAVDISFKSQIKERLLLTLGSSAREARHTSAQVIGKVASIDIPRKQWPELIACLLNNMTKGDSSGDLKQSTLETLSYVCEEISHNELGQDEVNSVLTAVVQGMNHAENSSDVRLAATKALYNALEFAESNFQNEMERNYIMKMVCETALSKEVEIRQAAFECLAPIASTYNDVLEAYMQTLFELTSNAVMGDEEFVALQAIEFWSSICDEEIELQEYENVDAGDSGFPHSRFIEKSLSYLVPMLLETLLKQEEDVDQDDGIWNISMAGGTCLGLVARTVGDTVLPLVMPFVEANIVKPDWRCQEAATMAFGSILEGPTTEKLSVLVYSGLDFLLALMKQGNNHVKDTTAWTIGRIFEYLHSPAGGFSVISSDNLPKVVEVLLESIKDAPNVSVKVCWAIYKLVEGYADAGSHSSLFSPYTHRIIESLLFAASRTNVDDSKLRSAAYESLNEVVRCSNIKETTQIMRELLLVILLKLSQTLELQIDKEKQAVLQASLCGVLQVIIQKVSSVDDLETRSIMLSQADHFMVLFLNVFACRSSTVHEEAMLVIGAVANATGVGFSKYLPEFYKYLEMGLQNFQEYQVCSITVGVVGDIVRVMNDQVLPYCDGIMQLLLADLSSEALDRSVKPPIFSVFSDIALAIEENFEKYVPYVVPMMQKAAEICAQMDVNDDELMEYGDQLKCSIIRYRISRLQF